MADKPSIAFIEAHPNILRMYFLFANHIPPNLIYYLYYIFSISVALLISISIYTPLYAVANIEMPFILY